MKPGCFIEVVVGCEVEDCRVDTVLHARVKLKTRGALLVAVMGGGGGTELTEPIVDELRAAGWDIGERVRTDPGAVTTTRGYREKEIVVLCPEHKALIGKVAP